MIPVDFPEKTVDLQKPPSMTDEECMPLPVHQSQDGRCISRWHAETWRERLRILFTGEVWLFVHSGHTQPPVWITGEVPFLRQKPKRESFWQGWRFPFTPR